MQRFSHTQRFIALSVIEVPFSILTTVVSFLKYIVGIQMTVSKLMSHHH